MNRQPSLRRRLLLAGGVGLLLVSLLASALLGELFKRSARDRLDHELQQDMLTLLAQAEVDADGQLRLRQEPMTHASSACSPVPTGRSPVPMAACCCSHARCGMKAYRRRLPARPRATCTDRCSSPCAHACSRCDCHAPANRS